MDPQIQNALNIAIQQITFALVAACVLVATTTIGILAKKGTEFLKVKLGATQLEQLKSIAKMIVRSVEQNPMFTQFDGAQKKEQVIVAVTNWCKLNSLPITHAFVDSLVEEAVQIMNSELTDYLDEYGYEDEPVVTQAGD